MNSNEFHFDSQLKQWIEILKKQLQQNQNIFNSLQPNDINNHFNGYWQQHKNYLDILFDFQNQSLDLLYLKINEKIHDGKTFQNFEEIYALWLECCESIYAKILANEQYHDFYANYINALFTYLQQMKNSNLNRVA